MHERPHYNPYSYEERLKRKLFALRWQNLHLDPYLITLLALLSGIGLLVLYSASNENLNMVLNQSIRFAIGASVMCICANLSPHVYYRWGPYLFILLSLLLCTVLIIGHISQGAQRWLNLGVFHFQPSELMKIAVPIMLARFLHEQVLPPSFKTILIAIGLIVVPTALTVVQPDLGTAVLISLSGLSVLFLAGISWRFIASFFALAGLSTPILWHFMHAYQKARVLTFFNPERAPLAAGYHIIQSKIAIGSGGLLGKGWLHGTQSHLQFLPAHATDFIFAVIGEEFGLIGCTLLICLFVVIFARALYISTQAPNTFGRLLSGSLALTFFISFFINIGMVIGILPIVGVPLPLISYGGTSIITMMAGFGIIMSIETHRKLT